MERVIALEGGRNFRDLGGYETQDGRRVKWRTLFRSGSMARLTPADYETLAGFAIKQICDFRTTGECTAEPNQWAQDAGIHYWSRDYETSFGDLRTVLASDAPTAEQAQQGMIAGYRTLPFEQAPAYKVLFQSLAKRATPIVFNCSAGKDRAGTAAALVLSALGVPRETVIEDYLLTNKVLDLTTMLAQRAQANSPITRNGMDIAAAILHTDERYLRAALDAVEAQHETVEAYLEEVLEISPQNLAAIREHFLE